MARTRRHQPDWWNIIPGILLMSLSIAMLIGLFTFAVWKDCNPAKRFLDERTCHAIGINR